MCPILLYLTVSSCIFDLHLSFDCCIHFFLLKGASQCWEPEGCSESIWDGCRRWEKDITILALQLSTPLCYCALNYTTLLCTTIPCLTKWSMEILQSIELFSSKRRKNLNDWDLWMTSCIIDYFPLSFFLCISLLHPPPPFPPPPDQFVFISYQVSDFAAQSICSSLLRESV